jgi:large subunit ribosomal protein L6
MSRIGNRIITVPENVTVEVKENTVFVKGPKGELNTPVAKNINVEVKENTVLVTRNNEQITTKQLHGTTNANIANMIAPILPHASEKIKEMLDL